MLSLTAGTQDELIRGRRVIRTASSRRNGRLRAHADE
jgi:hypothetical protein